MKKKLICILVCSILISTIIPFGINATVIYNPLDGGWMEEIDGITVLHVSGTYYEMGYQHGYFLKDEIQANTRMLTDFFNTAGFPYETLLHNWNIMKTYAPNNYIMEIQGIADGSGIPLEEIGVFNILHDTANLMHCCGAILWNDATINGELIHVRSGDLSVNIYDPISGTYFQENQVMLVHKPNDGFASMSPTWCGGAGTYGGINEKGIGVGETTCWTNETTLEGTCASFRMGEVLDTANNALRALQIMDSNKTCGWDLFISDGNEPIGYVLEQTMNRSYICTWDDPEESNDPFWKIDYVIRRGNCFLSKTCASTQRKRYDPSGVSGLFDFVTGQNAYFLIWNHYKALSKGIEKGWGSFDLNGTMDMLREVYSGKTDPIYHLLSVFIFPPQPIQQWVACPITGEMVVSFASSDKIASECPVHYFNLFKLIEKSIPEPIRIS